MIPQVVLYIVGIGLAARWGGPPLWARRAWAGDADDDESAEPSAP
jgi:hypothetical protein